MKKLKKLTAVLLAAVMALAMLTACGGGGSGSRNEKERYISKVNAYLKKRVTNFQPLTYDSSTDKTIKVYTDGYEGYIDKHYSDDDAKKYAKQAANLTDNDKVIHAKISTALTEQEKINKIADAILSEVTSAGLENNKWNVNYAWGEKDKKKDERTIYIILQLKETLPTEAE